MRVGAAAALVVGLAGWALERSRFGASDDAALRRVEDELRQRFDASAATLGAIAARVAAEPEAVRTTPRDPASVRRLFDAVSAAVPTDSEGATGITVYDVAGEPRLGPAASRSPKERVLGADRVLIAPGALGPASSASSRSRNRHARATVVVEQALGTLQAHPAERHVRPADIARRVTLRSGPLPPTSHQPVHVRGPRAQ